MEERRICHGDDSEFAHIEKLSGAAEWVGDVDHDDACVAELFIGELNVGSVGYGGEWGKVKKRYVLKP